MAIIGSLAGQRIVAEPDAALPALAPALGAVAVLAADAALPPAPVFRVTTLFCTTVLPTTLLLIALLLEIALLPGVVCRLVPLPIAKALAGELTLLPACVAALLENTPELVPAAPAPTVPGGVPVTCANPGMVASADRAKAKAKLRISLNPQAQNPTWERGFGWSSGAVPGGMDADPIAGAC